MAEWSRTRVCLVAGLVLLAALSVAVIYWVTSLSEPTVSIVSVKPREYVPGDNVLLFDVVVDVDNPNSIGGTVQRLRLDVSIEGFEVGVVDEEGPWTVLADSNTRMNITFRLGGVPLITSPIISVHVKGTVWVAIKDVTFTYPVERSDEIDLEEIAAINLPPVAVIFPSTLIVRSGQSMSFDGSGSYDSDGSITTHEWDFGDGDMAKGQSVDHSFSSRGFKVVTLTIRDNDNATSMAAVTISVI